MKDKGRGNKRAVYEEEEGPLTEEEGPLTEEGDPLTTDDVHILSKITVQVSTRQANLRDVNKRR